MNHGNRLESNNFIGIPSLGKYRLRGVNMKRHFISYGREDDENKYQEFRIPSVNWDDFMYTMQSYEHGKSDYHIVGYASAISDVASILEVFPQMSVRTPDYFRDRFKEVKPSRMNVSKLREAVCTSLDFPGLFPNNMIVDWKGLTSLESYAEYSPFMNAVLSEKMRRVVININYPFPYTFFSGGYGHAVFYDRQDEGLPRSSYYQGMRKLTPMMHVRPKGEAKQYFLK
jgi:hypothetical protein